MTNAVWTSYLSVLPGLYPAAPVVDSDRATDKDVNPWGTWQLFKRWRVGDPF